MVHILDCSECNVCHLPGLLSKVHAVVDGSQYELIRGLLAFNLGEQLESAESTAAGRRPLVALNGMLRVRVMVRVRVGGGGGLACCNWHLFS
jgi:hypothetical protein